jgi:hypothetical protein
MQFNARTTPPTVEASYAIADRQGWLVGETLEHTLAALERELAEQGPVEAQLQLDRGQAQATA